MKISIRLYKFVLNEFYQQNIVKGRTQIAVISVKFFFFSGGYLCRLSCGDLNHSNAVPLYDQIIAFENILTDFELIQCLILLDKMYPVSQLLNQSPRRHKYAKPVVLNQFWANPTLVFLKFNMANPSRAPGLFPATNVMLTLPTTSTDPTSLVQ